jgi:guanylate kinase
LTKAPEFDKQVVNDDLEVAVAEVAEIVKNFIA